jgi:hypothetical protein
VEAIFSGRRTVNESDLALLRQMDSGRCDANVPILPEAARLGRDQPLDTPHISHFGRYFEGELPKSASVSKRDDLGQACGLALRRFDPTVAAILGVAICWSPCLS